MSDRKRDPIAIALSIAALLLSGVSFVTNRKTDISRSEPFLHFSALVTGGQTSTSPQIDKASRAKLEDLKARDVRAIAWADDAEPLDLGFDLEGANIRTYYVWLLIEVTDGDCIDATSLEIDGRMIETPVSTRREDLGAICPDEGLLVPYFAYEANAEANIDTITASLRLDLAVGGCSLRFVTKTYDRNGKDTCVSAFAYQATLG